MLVFQPMDHVSVSPTHGIGPTQGQRKTLTRVGIEPTIIIMAIHKIPDGPHRNSIKGQSIYKKKKKKRKTKCGQTNIMIVKKMRSMEMQRS